jgi:hypothetical protein
MEHIRHGGGLSQGYFCMKCGQPVSIMGHLMCVPNLELVKQLIDLNKPIPIKFGVDINSAPR